jgi:hypothetical protein
MRASCILAWVSCVFVLVKFIQVLIDLVCQLFLLQV